MKVVKYSIKNSFILNDISKRGGISISVLKEETIVNRLLTLYSFYC